MGGTTYYERNTDVMSNRAKDYYENNKELLIERAKNKYLKKKKIQRENMEETDIIICLNKRNKN